MSLVEFKKRKHWNWFYEANILVSKFNDDIGHYHINKWKILFSKILKGKYRVDLTLKKSVTVMCVYRIREKVFDLIDKYKALYEKDVSGKY